MKRGAVVSVLEPKDAEREMITHISGIDAFLVDLREKIRAGELISDDIPAGDMPVISA
jgi:hypothetical protein